MSKINVLLLCGGGSDEHDISLISANFIQSHLIKHPDIELVRLELDGNGRYLAEDTTEAYLTREKELVFQNQAPNWKVDFVIPCFHGFPGETGDIQSLLTLYQIPFLGADAQASIHCFNKVTAKQWFTALGIPNTPYLFLSECNEQALTQAEQAFDDWGSIFIKASNQGSSVGCYKIENKSEIKPKLAEAFTFSDYVLIEKSITARELEVAVYEYDGEIVATLPGEIVCAENSFYSYEEKYASNSLATTDTVAKGLSKAMTDRIRQYAINVFKGMKISHLSRIDFFVTHDDEILLNEINTFPGMTPISMFPKMLENHGDDFSKFMVNIIKKETVT
ncbi:MAG: D-alanine--D-alanine ligase [Parashewanella sp.]